MPAPACSAEDLCEIYKHCELKHVLLNAFFLNLAKTDNQVHSASASAKATLILR